MKEIVGGIGLLPLRRWLLLHARGAYRAKEGQFMMALGDYEGKGPPEGENSNGRNLVEAVTMRDEHQRSSKLTCLRTTPTCKDNDVEVYHHHHSLQLLKALDTMMTMEPTVVHFHTLASLAVCKIPILALAHYEKKKIRERDRLHHLSTIFTSLTNVWGYSTVLKALRGSWLPATLVNSTMRHLLSAEPHPHPPKCCFVDAVSWR